MLTRWMRSDSQSFHLPQPNALLGLRLELLLHIVHYLPPSSAGLLTLCSKSLWMKLGSKYIEQLEKGKRQICPHGPHELIFPTFTEDQEQRNTFLLLLERDINDMIFCYFCQKLHKIYDTYRVAQTTCLHSYPGAIYWNGATFSSLYFAMKCYRKGLDISHILNQLSRTITDYRYKYTRQLLFTARVVSGSLYLRTQHWILLPFTQPLELPTSCYVWSLCWHVDTWQDPRLKHLFLSQCLQKRLREYQEFGTDAAHSTSTERCTSCRTEFQIDMKDMSTRGTAVVITVWQDFGEILTPFDLTWRSHFFSNPTFPFIDWRFVPWFAQESLKNNFEGGHFEFDAHQTQIDAANLQIKEVRDPSTYAFPQRKEGQADLVTTGCFIN
jgi:hypothetical protein